MNRTRGGLPGVFANALCHSRTSGVAIAHSGTPTYRSIQRIASMFIGKHTPSPAPLGKSTPLLTQPHRFRGRSYRLDPATLMTRRGPQRLLAVPVFSWEARTLRGKCSDTHFYCWYF